MGSNKTKTEHNGAKNGGGFWGKREEAKLRSRKKRRQEDKKLTKQNYYPYCLGGKVRGCLRMALAF